jgi:eukaryotic-like serine/threonine-protein kinase
MSVTDSVDVEGLGELVLLSAGSSFGSYVVHECIGQGAMGNVYRAEHALLEKPVALKVMDASLLANADARQRFLREGQAAAAIKHPNVVDITDVGVVDGTPYLVMELLEGEDLQIYLERGRQLSEQEIANLIIPIAAALGAAHDRGVVHRDLKPSNIFLARGPDGEIIPKILDFGISKIAEAVSSDDFESTPFNQLMGSPLYLPPEAVRGSRDLTAKSDQYSLGVVLYECVTGRAPFAGDSLMSLLNSISAGDFMRPSRLRPDVSMAMEHAVLRAMNPDPSLRFDHVRELGRELLLVAGMRTQMLWGRTFGRIDLSEPPPGPRTTSPVALVAVPSEPPAAMTAKEPEKARNRRHVLIGVATLAAILLPNLWAMRPSERAVTASALSPRERLPEPPLLEAPASPAREHPMPEPVVVAGEPQAEPGAEPEATPEVAADADESLARRRADVVSKQTAERARPAKRATRPTLAAEPRGPRPNLVPERRPLSPELSPEPYSDVVRDMFPGPAGGRDGARRPVTVGANESPILD